MNNQLDECTDLETFIGKIGHRLIKEGISLQALAEMWFDKGDEKLTVTRQHGIDLNDIGEQLLSVKSRLCQRCKLQEVRVRLVFNDSSDENAEKGN
jgi:hypothetical protein